MPNMQLNAFEAELLLEYLAEESARVHRSRRAEAEDGHHAGHPRGST